MVIIVTQFLLCLFAIAFYVDSHVPSYFICIYLHAFDHRIVFLITCNRFYIFCHAMSVSCTKVCLFVCLFVGCCCLLLGFFVCLFVCLFWRGEGEGAMHKASFVEKKKSISPL